ncbi:MAG: hypothetical protein U0Q15_15570 [Kineosporiaceae bacterium]
MIADLALSELIRATPTSLVWLGDQESDRIEFGAQGIICDVGAAEVLPWREIKGLSIAVPTMGRARFWWNRAFSTYGPMFYEHGISGGDSFSSRHERRGSTAVPSA